MMAKMAKMAKEDMQVFGIEKWRRLSKSCGLLQVTAGLSEDG
jgi:hypothetical protein